jgi:hypothetical protein
MSAFDSASAVRNPRRPALRDVRTLVAKDARAAVAPLAIAGVLSGAAVVLWARFALWELDFVTWKATDAELLVLQSLRSASIVCCAVLPAWAGVEVAFLESGLGRRSVLAAAPTSRLRVIGSKIAVVLLCAALVAASGAAADAILRAGGIPMGQAVLSRAPWLALLATCAALSGLGAPSIARTRVVGFAAALGLPAVIAGAAWTFGASAWQAAALAFLMCAILAWVARPVLAGEIGCDPTRTWRRGPAGIRSGGGGESGLPAGNRRVLAVLLGKDARVVRPIVLLALALIAGFVLFSLALPLFGERVMQDLGIGESDSVARRLKAAMPIALLAQLAMPAASALLLAYCDGRAVGRPLCALPAGVRAVVASKAVVCLAVFALFSAISLALLHVSEGAEEPLGGRLLSADGWLWAFLLLCASGIPWCLALPALVGDRRRAAIAAVVGVPLLFGCFGLAMQWSVRAWHDFVSVRMLGVGSWPRHTEASEISFGDFPPVVVTWMLTGVVAAWLARPAIAGIASTVRVRVHASRAILGTAVASVALGSLAYALPGFEWSEYRANADWARQVRSAMSDRTIDQLSRAVALRLATLPADPQRDAAGTPKFGSAVDAAAARAAIDVQPWEIARTWASAAWAKSPLQGSFEEELASGRARRGMAFTGPLECALAGRALREPAAVEAELRRIVDDPRAGGSARIVAAAWLGPVNAAMAAADVLANSPLAMERAFATVVLAWCSDSQRWRVSGGRSAEASPTVDTQPPLDSRKDLGFDYCMRRLMAINALHDLERRVRQPSAEDAATGWLGLASNCRIDLATVMRARALLENGPSDLCEILQALGNLPTDEYPESPDVVEGACECLGRPVHPVR